MVKQCTNEAARKQLLLKHWGKSSVGCFFQRKKQPTLRGVKFYIHQTGRLEAHTPIPTGKMAPSCRRAVLRISSGAQLLKPEKEGTIRLRSSGKYLAVNRKNN
jgi:hypothetical protein